jgi:Fe(3+) dicitrate transport protein
MLLRYPFCDRPRAMHGSMFASALLLSFPLSVVAQDTRGRSERDTVQLPGVSVVGTPDRLARIPGSVERIDARQLKASRVFTTNEALRKVPGLVVRDEEGLGLRPNIGVRGLNPTRSTKVLLLEDGIPFTIAPYGDNAAYYHPPIERMESIEVLKGAGQILYGPQTVGGVINYLTPSIPRTPSAGLSVTGGSRAFTNVHAKAGGTFGEAGGTGVLADYIRRSGDGARANTSSEVDDASFKLLVPLSATQQLTFRGNAYRERSTVTYSGLTEAEYAQDPRQNPFANDGFDITRVGGAVAHRIGRNERRNLTTTLYGYRINRDWWRQSSNSAQRPNDRNDPTCGGMANLLTSCGNEGRLREYVVVGIEPRGTWQWVRSRAIVEVDAGARAHHESQERLQVNASSPRGRTIGVSGNVNAGLVEDNRRTTDAYATYLQARVATGTFTLSGGLRGEALRLVRVNRRPVANAPDGAQGSTTMQALIPGLGATVQLREGLTAFAGVHRGFAPPRPEDIISNSTGGVVELDAELSWNSEVGIRWLPARPLRLEATVFNLDFSNQIVPASVAGGTGAALTSAGRTLHRGAELSLRAEPARRVGGVGLFTEVAAAWTPVARFEGDRFAYIGTGGSDVIGRVYAEQNAGGSRTRQSVTGNRLPYAPEYTLTTTVGVRHRSGSELRVEGVAISEQFGDAANTRLLVSDGQQGPLSGNVLWNVTANVPVPRTTLSAWVAIKNLTGRTVVVDRTRGLLPGLPRLVQMGLSYSL